MKAIFETTDIKEAQRIIAADNMANALWEIVHNAWRIFENTDYDYQKAWDEISDTLEEYNINIDELVD
ncbi:MAG: hypothetical protein PHS99_08800 [Candidatus Marinimicrobia bacterium]|nr:hypothetical protein [Candidatus Neomarinimicrobiota bacterium]